MRNLSNDHNANERAKAILIQSFASSETGTNNTEIQKLASKIDEATFNNNQQEKHQNMSSVTITQSEDLDDDKHVIVGQQQINTARSATYFN